MKFKWEDMTLAVSELWTVEKREYFHDLWPNSLEFIAAIPETSNKRWEGFDFAVAFNKCAKNTRDFKLTRNKRATNLLFEYYLHMLQYFMERKTLQDQLLNVERV